jgi:hypothetical protein
VIATFHLTRYDRIRDGMPHMWFDRALLRETRGLRFWKLLGTPNPREWAMFAVWEDEPALPPAIEQRFASAEHREWRLHPIRWHGTWGGEDPFAGAEPAAVDGPIAVLTRATIRPRSLIAFQRAIPPLPPGTIQAGELPIGRQATFSVWPDLDALVAYRASHRDVIRATREGDWYSEELFARFAISDATRSAPSMTSGSPPPG